MADILLFHHSQGRTPGFLAFADTIRQAGHTVHTPDLFDGKTFGSIDEGMAYIRGVGFDHLVERGEGPDEIVEFIAGMTDRFALSYVAEL